MTKDELMDVVDEVQGLIAEYEMNFEMDNRAGIAVGNATDVAMDIMNMDEDDENRIEQKGNEYARLIEAFASEEANSLSNDDPDEDAKVDALLEMRSVVRPLWKF